jgi:hypothetical protein
MDGDEFTIMIFTGKPAKALGQTPTAPKGRASRLLRNPDPTSRSP